MNTQLQQTLGALRTHGRDLPAPQAVALLNSWRTALQHARLPGAPALYSDLQDLSTLLAGGRMAEVPVQLGLVAAQVRKVTPGAPPEEQDGLRQLADLLQQLSRSPRSPAVEGAA